VSLRCTSILTKAKRRIRSWTTDGVRGECGLAPHLKT
jgi:hypothetical protein